MDLTATYAFRAPTDVTWNLLMDVGAIAACLPGCRELRPSGVDRYDVELGVAFAAITGTFTGTVAIEDKAQPQSYTLAVDGSGRQGFIKGRTRVTLESQGDRTLVHIAAHAEVGGTIARLGQRLLEGAARTMMDRFFACLVGRITRPPGS